MKKKKIYGYLLIILFCIIISVPLLRRGMIQGHDLRFHLSRILAVSEGFSSGSFWNYIHYGYLNNYGYASGLFYSNVFIWIPAFFKVLGVNLLDSYKILIVICNFSTAFSMYYCMKKVTKREKIAVIASILYLLNPYRICDIFVRAALGEVLAFIFIPFVLLGIYEFVQNKGKIWWYLTFGFVGLIFSHLISVIIVFLVCLVFFLINYKKLFNKETFINLLKAVIMTILLTAFYTFPMLEQYIGYDFIVNTKTVNYDISAYTIPFLKLFSGISSWYNNMFIPSGISFVILYILLLRFKIDDFKFKKICDICLISGIILTLCATDFLPWSRLSILSIIQFPWRFYIIAFSFLTIAAAVILDEYSKNKSKKYIVLVLLFALVVPIFNVYNQYVEEYTWRDYSDYNLGGKEYIPANVDINKLIERGEVVTSNNDVEIDFKRVDNEIVVYYKGNSWKDTYIELPLLYYDGYCVTDDLKISSGDNGVVRVYLNGKSGNLRVYYSGTDVAKISVIISVGTIILGIVWLFIRRFKYEKR